MQLDIHFPDRLAFHIRRSNRARRPSVSVCLHDGVVLTLPQRFDERHLPALLTEWQPWIDKQVAHYEAHRARLPAEMFARLPENIALPACGGRWQVSYAGSGKTTRVVDRDGTLTVHNPSGEEASARATLNRWLARTARRHLQARLEELSRLHDLHYQRLTVRGQRTRWGSCSSTGTISLNYLLMFLAPELADSVVLHELCHTRYMSHGPRFYGLLRRLQPRYDELDQRVREGWQAIPDWAWPHRTDTPQGQK
ncbi:MAG: M48 family metallopeptidase [Gammaproteobacteria bacterium]